MLMRSKRARASDIYVDSVDLPPIYRVSVEAHTSEVRQ